MRQTLSAIAIALGVGVFSAPLAVSANSITAIEVTHKVNIAGRQRMLSQRMAKAACMMSADIGAPQHFQQMSSAYDLFVRSDNALRYGSVEMELPAENRRAVMRALGRIDVPWAGYSNIIEEVMDEGTAAPDEMVILSAASNEVLKFMNMAVNQTARSYGNVLPDVSLSLTITIDVAGRQRMLTQKAMKETCLMFITGDEGFAQGLERTISLFDLSLTALEDGFEDVGVMAAPNGEIAQQLAYVRELWTPIHAHLRAASAAGAIDGQTLADLALDTDVLLREMNRAVGMYEYVKTGT